MEHSTKHIAVFGVPSVAVVTGASRGIGKDIALKLVENIGSGSMLILTARSEGDLEATATKARELATSLDKALHVCCVVADLSRDEGLVSVTDQLKQVDSSKYQHFILINNAASLGDIQRWAHEFPNVSEVQDYFQLNLSSMISLISTSLEVFKPDGTRRITIVNLSSVVNVVTFKGLSLYSSSKAARHMYMKVLGEEQKERVRVLSYDPGLVDTVMFYTAGKQVLDSDTRTFFEDGRATSMRQPEETAEALMKLLQKDTFQNGAHVSIDDFLKEQQTTSN